MRLWNHSKDKHSSLLGRFEDSETNFWITLTSGLPTQATITLPRHNTEITAGILAEASTIFCSALCRGGRAMSRSGRPTTGRSRILLTTKFPTTICTWPDEFVWAAKLPGLEESKTFKKLVQNIQNNFATWHRNDTETHTQRQTDRVRDWWINREIQK